MKFSTISTLSGLASLATAGTHVEQHVCTDGAPQTVYETITVTAGGNGGSPGNNHPITYQQGPPPTSTYITTGAGSVTSCDYAQDKTSVWVYPTGSPDNKDCTVAIYEKNVVTVIVVNIHVTIINGATTTVTSTVTDAPKPTYTPTPPILPPNPPHGNGTGKVHNVIVGADGALKYKKDQVDAEIGDIIRFDFLATNHTVTQSSLLEPCKPLAGGFDTGFNQFNPQNITGLKVVDFTVNVKTPLWFYCRQGVHCAKGMVLGVNPAGKFPEFLSRATNTATTLGPSGTAPVTSLGPSGTAPGGTGSPAKPTAGPYKYPAIKARAFAA